MRPHPPVSSFSLMLWQMFRLLHGKHELKLQTLAKQWHSMKAFKLFRKYPKTPNFDHSNYQLFERIPAVPGTSNNRGLTVVCFKDFKIFGRTISLTLKYIEIRKQFIKYHSPVCQQNFLRVYVFPLFTHCMKVACWHRGGGGGPYSAAQKFWA